MDWKSHRIDALLEQALLEDQAHHDATTHLTVDANLRAAGSIIAKEELVVAGLGAIPRFFEIYARLDRSPEGQTRFEVVSHPEMFDGVRVHAGQVLAVIRHNARVLLSCERVILNLLQHMSGIATLTRQFADAIQGTHARVLDTRKTVPGMRALEKYAVLCGGGTNHRIDLASGILIKSNHIALGGGIATALKRALAQRKPGQRVQVEVRNAQELEEALAHGAEAILLDNMTPAEVRRSIERIKTVTGGTVSGGDTATSEPSRWIPTEASGGIVLDTVRAFAETGVDFISVGALTHSARAADISMTIAAEHGHSRHQGHEYGHELNSQAHAARKLMFDLAALEAELAGTVFAGKLHFVRSTGSTNSDAIAAARGEGQLAGAPHGSVYFADEQLAGRGRGDHDWISVAGEGLYVSVLLRPQIPASRLALLPLAAGLAAADSIRTVSGLDVDLRWPNDLLIGPRKAGGILVEANLESKSLPYAVVGIGINVHQHTFPPGLATPATSLDLEASRAISRQTLLVALLKSLERETQALSDATAAKEILARVEKASTWIRGRNVEVHGPQSCTGVTAGLDENGFLRVATASGLVTVQTGGLRAAEKD